jgi:NhaP-type Na+/H+ or K+/H+ antiporter
MESYILILLVLGIIGFLMAWLSVELEDVIISFPMIMVALGVILYSLPLNLPNPDPVARNNFVLHLTELAVIISLMGTGLKINKPFSITNFRVPFLMIIITMIGCIITVALTGWLIAGLLPASALLLGAVFAPTDPVIADDVQVEFHEQKEHPVPFSLTAEAGLNDGMAFPFTWFAVLAASYGMTDLDWIKEWLLRDVGYRIIIGGVAGFILGRILAYTLFSLPKSFKFPPIRREFVAIACTFLVYSLVESIHGYGFIAVFAAGLTLRHYEREHEFHQEMHDFIDQIEKILLALVLFLLGGYAATHMFKYLYWEAVLSVIVFIFIIRPLFGRLALFNTEMKRKEKWLVSFMGMKGVGSFFYLAFALQEIDFANNEQLWATTGFLVLASVVIHGGSLYFLKSLFSE